MSKVMIYKKGLDKAERAILDVVTFIDSDTVKGAMKEISKKEGVTEGSVKRLLQKISRYNERRFKPKEVLDAIKDQTFEEVYSEDV